MVVALAMQVAAAASTTGPETQRHYLSGHGPADAVPWEFMVNGGRRAGQMTTIPVPSQWELQGFGTYNYGQEPRKKADEQGFYRIHFKMPAGWEGRRVRIVFEGVMTDTKVAINGRPAGPVHQGGFTRFSFDITRLLKPGGDNLLEVWDSKVCAEPDLEIAERAGDFWVFGGIYRPVYLEAVPMESIQQVAIDARADGSLRADVSFNNVRPSGRVEAQVLAADGAPVGEAFAAEIPGGGTAQVRLSTRLAAPKLWTAETPQLYQLRLTLVEGGQSIHTVTDRFGFRTFEVRAGQGLFLNGQRIMLKGVDRHSFRPETGRALTNRDCYDDVRLMKEMNLNAVRMSHYPPDVAFLEACDELGLYVLDELTAWQHPVPTAAGRILIRELVNRDVNHPSILFWDNGNEGGFNRELDGDFAQYDPSRRLVLHPWDPFNGVDTKHYPIYAEMQKRLKGPNIFFPTEMLHGIYDGGAGAGLEDAWKIMSTSPFGGGGFIWVFADEGVIRTDQGNRVDVFSTFAPDGIVGPHHEKEGSFNTVRQIYSPVQVDPPVLDGRFDGKLVVHNHYSFVGLDRCHLGWKWVKLPGPAAKSDADPVVAEGVIEGPAVGPGQSGTITLPRTDAWTQADALTVTAFGPSQEALWTWVWEKARPRITLPDNRGIAESHGAPIGPGDRVAPPIRRAGGLITLTVAGLSVSFDESTARLREVRSHDSVLPLTNGPRLIFARPAAENDVTWLPTDGPESHVGVTRLKQANWANLIELSVPKGPAWVGFHLEISPDGEHWKTLFASSRRPSDGNRYDFPQQRVAAVRISHLHRNDEQPAAINRLAVGLEPNRFPADNLAPGSVTTGTGKDSASGEPAAWIERTGGDLKTMRWTLQSSGVLRLDYRYALEGEFAFHGITFDLPEDQMRGLRWLGLGPSRVWQNRLPGTWLGVHRVAHNEIQAGEAWNYPEGQGYFGGLHWATLETASGPMTLTDSSGRTYLRVGTPRINLTKTSPDFPAGDLSILQAIPAIGSKFHSATQTGPHGQWAKASGEYSGSLTFEFGPPAK
jgi:hypothetical protein